MSEYVRMSDGLIAEGPIPCPKVWQNINGFHLLSDQEKAQHGWFRFHGDPEPEYDPRTQKVVRRLLVGDIVRSEATVESLSDSQVAENLEALRSEMLADNADYRWQKETNGIVFKDIPIHTDRDSQITIFAAAIRGQDEMWKGQDGNWHHLSALDLAMLSESIAEMKRMCFQKEAELAVRINGCETFQQLDQIDLESEWNAFLSE